MTKAVCQDQVKTTSPVKTSPVAAKPPEDKPKPANVISDKTKVSVTSNREKRSDEKPVVSRSSGKCKKPKILTHVIEGFIIQEASEPFPVSSVCVWSNCECALLYDEGMAEVEEFL